MNPRFRYVALLLLLCMGLSLLCSCRSSPALEETIYTYQAPEVDEEQQMLDPEDEGEETEELQNQEQAELETERDTQAEEGQAAEEGEAEIAAEISYNATAQEELPAQETAQTTAQTDAQGSGEPEESAAPAEPDSVALAAEAEIAEALEEAIVQPARIPSQQISYKQVVDASGATVDVPENVQTVTAVGYAAQIVEMLGGSGRLVGTNSDLLDSWLAVAAFADYSSLQAWWQGDGSSPLSEASFAALLAAQPDVCLEISGQNTFTEAQIQQLQEAGIAYVVLPTLSSQNTLLLAVQAAQLVQLVAQILGTSSDGTDCMSIATQYISWVETVISEVSQATSGTELTSLYIADWDSSATYLLSDTKGVIPDSGSGLAVAYSPAKSQLVSVFMSVANVTNESTRTKTHKDSDYVYVTPMFHQFSPTVSGSMASYYSGAGEYGAAYDLFVARMYSTVYYQLGSSQFPAIVVANEEIKAALEANWFWQYYPAGEDGYLHLDGEKFYRAIVGDYAIYVNPSGMLNWAEGSVESPLEAYWIACKLQGAYTIEEVKAKTSAFYQSFFGLQLTQAQLEAIFGE